MSDEQRILVMRLVSMEGTGIPSPRPGREWMEFHVAREARERFAIEDTLFSSTGNVVMPNFYAVRVLAQKMNESLGAAVHPDRTIKAGRLNAMALIDEILHYVCSLYREKAGPDAFTKALATVGASIGIHALDKLLLDFTERFPPASVWKNTTSAGAWLSGSTNGVPNKALALEELFLLRLANENPAFEPYRTLFDDTSLGNGKTYAEAMLSLEGFFAGMPKFGPDDQSLVDMLRSPAVAAPFSLPGQLEYIRTRWGLVLGSWLRRLLAGLDFIREEEKPYFPGPGPARVLAYEGLEHEYERFTPDKDWMPKVVMLAKTSLVWLSQLSAAYGFPITRLDQIPDEELDRLASSGFNSLWLIGLWERSAASARIKHVCGNPEAASSAYSLFNYEISGELGGWSALENLRERCAWRGIKLASDMVPNHTGIDSDWIRNRPDLFVSLPSLPFPGYTYNGDNISGDPNVGIWLEDHYYSRNDAAVVFKRVDFRSGDTKYIYHGNDGTSMPWNDTAQIDFLNPAAREEVIRQILHVAHNFPVIRFDAAMVLAKRHIRRLWYPEPGHGGDVPSRSEHALTREEFDARIPVEFWREVVDRCAAEAPDTLLLAEAFWMLEGYFVRTLGMHRVYNSAFMNMLKREENDKYRSTVRNTQEFDKDILKRFVNFMNNPDEETAIAQFGSGDKYFGVCTMMVTMPGLPMFGHGQIEGYTEKYGMEYRKAYYDERPNEELVSRHEREIFPLMKRRHLFSGVEEFLLYDLYGEHGKVNENVFAYSNGRGNERALVLYNNAFARASGWIRDSAAYAEKLPDGGKRLERKTVGSAFGLSPSRDRFLLMREQRSGLWFLRRSADILGKGMFVNLDGYQCQVFLDIVEIPDGPLGQYGALCDLLNGAGVRDVDAAMQDVFLKDLYASFRKLASPEFFRAVRSVAIDALTPTAPGTDVGSVRKSFLAGLAPAASELFLTARVFLKGTSYYAAFERETAAERTTPEMADAGAPSPKRGAAKTAVTDGETGERAATALAESFSTLFGIFDSCAALERERGSSFLASGFRELAWSPEFAAVYVIMSWMRRAIDPAAGGEDARALVDHWCLDRKLRETLQETGVPGDVAWKIVVAEKAVLARSGAGSGEPGPFYDGCADAAEMRDALGVNVFDGAVWFNKERFETLAFYAALAVALDASPAREAVSAGPPVKRVDAAGGIAKAEKFLGMLYEAERESGYRFDQLGRILSPSIEASSPDGSETKATDGRSAPKAKKPKGKTGP
ncbi:MAG: alpha-amylase family glycosyl hydrolase [Spirochaetes bacterium]|nr:alpha-amylase family glycosyl hydrolase [Spirochaetota bacterium]